MQLDLNSVDSIVAWWRVWPERHDSYLDYKLLASPEFAHSIRSARRLIEARPELHALKRAPRPSWPAFPAATPDEADLRTAAFEAD
jgi:hypothetical protein